MGLVDNRIEPEELYMALTQVQPTELIHRMQHYHINTYGQWDVLVHRCLRYELRRRGLEVPWDVNTDAAVPDWYPSPVRHSDHRVTNQASMVGMLVETSLTRTRAAPASGTDMRVREILYQAESLGALQRQTMSTRVFASLTQRRNEEPRRNTGAIPRTRRVMDSTPEDPNAAVALMNASYEDLHNLSPIQKITDASSAPSGDNRAPLDAGNAEARRTTEPSIEEAQETPEERRNLEENVELPPNGRHNYVIITEDGAEDGVPPTPEDAPVIHTGTLPYEPRGEVIDGRYQMRSSESPTRADTTETGAPGNNPAETGLIDLNNRTGAREERQWWEQTSRRRGQNNIRDNNRPVPSSPPGFPVPDLNNCYGPTHSGEARNRNDQGAYQPENTPLTGVLAATQQALNQMQNQLHLSERARASQALESQRVINELLAERLRNPDRSTPSTADQLGRPSAHLPPEVRVLAPDHNTRTRQDTVRNRGQRNNGSQVHFADEASGGRLVEEIEETDGDERGSHNSAMYGSDEWEDTPTSSRPYVPRPQGPGTPYPPSVSRMGPRVQTTRGSNRPTPSRSPYLPFEVAPEVAGQPQRLFDLTMRSNPFSDETLMESTNRVSKAVEQFSKSRVTFAGRPEEDVEAFLSRLRTVIKCLGLTEPEVLQALPIAFTEKAEKWFLQKEPTIRSYAHFLYLFRLNYGEATTRTQIRKDLYIRSQGPTESVRRFVDDLDWMMCSLGYHETERVEQTLDKLHPDVYESIARSRPRTMAELLAAAQVAEEVVEHRKRYRLPPPPEETAIPERAYHPATPVRTSYRSYGKGETPKDTGKYQSKWRTSEKKVNTLDQEGEEDKEVRSDRHARNWDTSGQERETPKALAMDSRDGLTNPHPPSPETLGKKIEDDFNAYPRKTYMVPCWNCGYPGHGARHCKYPKNPATIERNRQTYLKNHPRVAALYWTSGDLPSEELLPVVDEEGLTPENQGNFLEGQQ